MADQLALRDNCCRHDETPDCRQQSPYVVLRGLECYIRAMPNALGEQRPDNRHRLVGDPSADGEDEIAASGRTRASLHSHSLRDARKQRVEVGHHANHRQRGAPLTDNLAERRQPERCLTYPYLIGGRAGWSRYRDELDLTAGLVTDVGAGVALAERQPVTGRPVTVLTLPC